MVGVEAANDVEDNLYGFDVLGEYLPDLVDSVPLQSRLSLPFFEHLPKRVVRPEEHGDVVAGLDPLALPVLFD